MSVNGSVTIQQAILRKTSREQAAAMTSRLLASYPSADPPDPEGYVAEMVLMLMEYSVVTAERGLADAMTESPQFLPSVPMVRIACNSHRLLTAGPEWEENSRKQLAARKAIDDYNGEEPGEHRKAVVERLWPEGSTLNGPKAKPIEKAFRQFTDDELRALYGKREARE